MDHYRNDFWMLHNRIFIGFANDSGKTNRYTIRRLLHVQGYAVTGVFDGWALSRDCILYV